MAITIQAPSPITDELVARIRRRAHELGIRGNNGGWLVVGKKSLQGWFAVAEFVTKRSEKLPVTLREIANDTRVGVPTLSRDDTDEMVAALLSNRPVSLRSSTV